MQKHLPILLPLLLALTLLLPVSPAAAMSRLTPGSSIVVIELGFAGQNFADGTYGISRHGLARAATENVTQLFAERAGSKLTLLNLDEDSPLYPRNEAERSRISLTDDEAIRIGQAMQADYVVVGTILGAGLDESSSSSIIGSSASATETVSLSLRVMSCHNRSIIAMTTQNGRSKTGSSSNTVLQLANAVLSLNSGQTENLGALSDKTIDHASIMAAQSMLNEATNEAADKAAKALLQKLGY